MIISESIRAWVRNHDLQDTLRLMGSGEVIVFIAEEMTTADSMAATVLTAAYMYFEVERERRSELGREAYLRKAAAGEYTPRQYLGYAPGTFIPDENRKFVVEMFLEASQGVEADEIAESELKLYNFRRFKSVDGAPGLHITFHKGLNALIGENDSGKTAVIDALKFVLLTESNDYIRPTDEDFYKGEQA